MRILILLLLCLVVSCTSDQPSEWNDYHGWKPRFVDSFSFRGHTAILRESENSKGDSFLLTCTWQGRQLLNYVHLTSSAFVRAQDIYGSAEPELVLDDCVACEGFRSLRVFYFDTTNVVFLPVKGLDSISSDFFRLPHSDLYYDTYAHNRGGQESTLFRLAGDSCIVLGKLFMPYSEEATEVELRTPRRKTIKVPYSEAMDDDTAIAAIWRKVLR